MEAFEPARAQVGSLPYVLSQQLLFKNETFQKSGAPVKTPISRSLLMRTQRKRTPKLSEASVRHRPACTGQTWWFPKITAPF